MAGRGRTVRSVLSGRFRAKSDEQSLGTVDRERRTDESSPAAGLLARMGRWQLVTTAGLAAVALSLVALAIAHSQHYGPRVRDSTEAMQIVRTAHAAMLDKQGGLRAYALTGDDRFLEAVTSAEVVLEEIGSRRLPVEQRTSQLHLDLRLAQAAWTDRWVPEAGELGAAGGNDDEAGGALLVEGKALFDDYRTARAGGCRRPGPLRGEAHRSEPHGHRRSGGDRTRLRGAMSRGDADQLEVADDDDAQPAAGSVKVKVDPRPSSLSRSSPPDCSCA